MCRRHLSVGTEATAIQSFDAPLVEIGFRRQHWPSCWLFSQIDRLVLNWDFAKRYIQETVNF
jgi:hypothetical protein